jgi:hypothetical protein
MRATVSKQEGGPSWRSRLLDRLLASQGRAPGAAWFGFAHYKCCAPTEGTDPRQIVLGWKNARGWSLMWNNVARESVAIAQSTKLAGRMRLGSSQHEPAPRGKT